MAGVASPMIREAEVPIWSWARLFLGLLFGLTISSGFVGLMATFASYALDGFRSYAVFVVAALGIALAVSDARDRTWQIIRQVPQRFVRLLPPGRLGFVWGLDLGTLFSTQRATSLGWFVLAGTIVAGENLPLISVLCFIWAYWIAIVVASFAGYEPRPVQGRRMTVRARRLAAVLISIVSLLLPLAFV